ncbi:MAG TPA: glycosyltransferase family 39 protein, partial [Anaerolineae bacterium]
GLGYGSQENGFRTPTYPLFIAAILLPFKHADLSSCREARVPACLGEAQQEPSAQANLRAIVAVQILFGTLTILLVYWFAWKITQQAWVAALCAFTYPIDLSTGYWEISVLTDTLTTFLLMLTACLTLLAAEARRYRGALHAALGVVLGALALCHSVYLLYAIVPAAFLWLHQRQSGRHQPNSDDYSRHQNQPGSDDFSRHPLHLAFVLVIPAVFVLAWSARNYRVDGYFTPSTISGYNLTQMVGPFMEQAPPSYRDLANIYLDYRADRIAIRGSHSGTIFFAYRDMLSERGTTWAGLSQMLTAMSLQMIAQHPQDYARVFWQSFVQFWKFGLGRQNYQLPISFDWVKWFLDTRVHDAWMALFFITPLALALLQFTRRSETSAVVWIWFAIFTVLYAALFSSAFNFGDNERYRTHVARLQYSAVIATAWLLLQAVTARLETFKNKDRSIV